MLLLTFKNVTILTSQVSGEIYEGLFINLGGFMNVGISHMVGATVNAASLGYKNVGGARAAAPSKKQGLWCKFKCAFGHKHHHSAAKTVHNVGRTGSETSTQSAPAAYNSKGAAVQPKATIARSQSEGNVTKFSPSSALDLATQSLNFAKAATSNKERGEYFDNAAQYAKLSAALGSNNAAKFLHTLYQNGIKSVGENSVVREDPKANTFWNKVSRVTIPQNYKNMIIVSKPFSSTAETVAVFMAMSGEMHGDKQLNSDYIHGLSTAIAKMQQDGARRIPTEFWLAYQVSTSKNTI